MNMRFEFLQHLLAYKDLIGELWVGGMSMRVAEYFDIDLTRYYLQPSAFIDLLYLTVVGVLEVGCDMAMSKCEGRFTSLSE